MTATRADRAVDLLAVAVVVSVGLAAGPVAWRMSGRDDGRRSVAAVAAAPAAAPLDLTPLKRIAPFGVKVAAGGTPGDPTALGLQLRGVLLARPASASVAIIAAGSPPAAGFRVGATLPGGAILDAIEFDLVVLRVGGKLVTLALPARTKPTLAGSPAMPAVAGVPAAAPKVNVIAPVGVIEAYRARAQDPLSLLGSLGATAGPDGYRVGPSPSEDLRRAGLQPGDIVEKVNGEAIGNPARDRALFDEAVVAGRMRVDVVRDGKHIALSFPLH